MARARPAGRFVDDDGDSGEDVRGTSGHCPVGHGSSDRSEERVMNTKSGDVVSVGNPPEICILRIVENSISR